MSEPRVAPRGDMVLVRLSEKQTYSDTIIIPDSVASAHPVQKAVVLRVGPGRRLIRRAQADKDSDKVFIPTEVSPGDQVVFFTVAKDTRQGQQLAAYVGEGYALIRQSDILFVYEGDLKVEV
jgi:co-chaperonin GroES (HSP10)